MSDSSTVPNSIIQSKADRAAAIVIGAASAVILGFLFWLVYFRPGATGSESDWVGRLPALNAALNALSAACLTAGYIAIRMKKVPVHVGLMLSALVFSGLFLVSYIVYHTYHGDTKFTGAGAIRPVYFFILISHIILSVGMLPMILTTLYLAARKRFAAHRRVARITLPIWIYVSITGVVVFFMLRAYSGG